MERPTVWARPQLGNAEQLDLPETLRKIAKGVAAIDWRTIGATELMGRMHCVSFNSC